MKQSARTKIYKQAVEKWGEPLQIIMFMEESAELTKLLTKYLRNGSFWFNDVLEELADVSIIIEQLRLMFKISKVDINLMKERKLNRLKDRLKD